jgi:ABC-type glycerol-3-phosphate transport system substrate-binding protein
MSFFTTRRTLLASAVLLATMPGVSHARCETLSNVKPGEINIVGNSFPALQHIAKEMQSCTQGGLKVQFKMTPQIQQEVQQAFGSAGKSAFDAGVVSMGVFADLQSKGQLQPITDLVNKYKAKYKIEDNMLIKVNGEVMAIAFMQNAQNLFYRKDLFDKHGLKAPASYADMIAVAKTLREKEPGVEFPIAQTFAKGWDSATEFSNIFAGFGGRFFKPGSAAPDFNSDAGVKAFETMKAMTAYMTPNYLASNSDDVMNQFQQGKAAMGVLWATRASRMDDAAASKIVRKMEFTAAPAAVPGGRSATHLWWDGVVMPKNLAGDRETVFQVLMEALDEETTPQRQRPDDLDSLGLQAHALRDRRVGVCQGGCADLAHRALFRPGPWRDRQGVARRDDRRHVAQAGAGYCGGGLYQGRHRKGLPEVGWTRATPPP